VKRISCLVLSVILTLPLQAGAAGDTSEPTETRKTVAMSQAVYEKLQAAQALVEKKDYRAALALTGEALGGKKALSAYETAQVWNLTAYIHYLQEDYARASEAYAKVLAQPDLPEALVQSTLKTQAQLQFTREKYAEALATAQKLAAVVKEPTPDIPILIGQAQYQLGKYREAIAAIREGIDRYRSQGKPPQEGWLLLLRACHHELKDYQGMLGVVRELVAAYPKDDYLLALAALYSELGDTRKQLALTETLFDRGYLKTPADAENLVNLFLLHEQPLKAARLLEAQLGAGSLPADERHLTLLSQAWYQAREDKRAIPPLEKAAALAATGELYTRLAQSHLNLSAWPAAAEAARKAIAKGGLTRPDTAQVMLGMALFNENQLTAARSAFEEASRDRRSAKLASQWLGFINAELARQETMQQVLPDAAPIKQDKILEAMDAPG